MILSKLAMHWCCYKLLKAPIHALWLHNNCYRVVHLVDVDLGVGVNTWGSRPKEFQNQAILCTRGKLVYFNCVLQVVHCNSR